MSNETEQKKTEQKKTEQTAPAALSDKALEQVPGGSSQDMFNGCKGIEKVPDLPVPKLEKIWYTGK